MLLLSNEMQRTIIMAYFNQVTKNSKYLSQVKFPIFGELAQYIYNIDKDIMLITI
jgi:hypothetical protein